MAAMLVKDFMRGSNAAETAMMNKTRVNNHILSILKSNVARLTWIIAYDSDTPYILDFIRKPFYCTSVHKMRLGLVSQQV